jgi:hypothetical protein
LWRIAVEAASEMTYLIVVLLIVLIGLVIENALRGPLKATRTGSQAAGGGDGGGGGSCGGGGC